MIILCSIFHLNSNVNGSHAVRENQNYILHNLTIKGKDNVLNSNPARWLVPFFSERKLQYHQRPQYAGAYL
jgi:hypothetical protein